MKTRTLNIVPLRNNTSLLAEGLRSPANNASGFSILEILIAISLVAAIGYVVLGGIDLDGKNSMDEAIDDIERAVRFSVNETVLRGSIVRVKFNISESPVKYVIEYGPKSGFVLPEFSDFDNNKGLSLRDQERLNKLKESISSRFKKITEFSDDAKTLPDDVKLIGVASTLRSNKLITEDDVSVYFYPNGEKDSVLMIFANNLEVTTLELFPFTDEISRNYYTLNESDTPIEDLQFTKANELYEQWIK